MEKEEFERLEAAATSMFAEDAMTAAWNISRNPQFARAVAEEIAVEAVRRRSGPHLESLLGLSALLAKLANLCDVDDG
ncbi:MAG: hypothetical protein ACPG6R_10935 [Aequoribacter sp.]|uniref:hypothetical protein n=1 Tax=Aequoribacter sp. TaxID=2847771 RepID=UPI003C414B81